MSQNNNQAEKPKQDKPQVDKAALSQSIADKKEVMDKKKIVKK